MTTLKGKSQFLIQNVEGEVDKSKILILIDGGAMHNFIDEDFIKEIEIKMQEYKGFDVTVGNEIIS